jgi:hypothetical protein
MILLSDLRVYGESLKERIDGINYFGTVLDESEISRGLNSINNSQNTLLFLVIPEAAASGSSQDNLRNQTTLDFILVDKTIYKEGHEKYIGTFETTQLLAIELGRTIFNDADSGCHELLSFIDYANYGIRPVNAQAGCNGWMLQFGIKSSL